MLKLISRGLEMSYVDEGIFVAISYLYFFFFSLIHFSCYVTTFAYILDFQIALSGFLSSLVRCFFKAGVSPKSLNLIVMYEMRT